MLRRYDSSAFRSGNRSYAGQGYCSSGDGKLAMFMERKFVAARDGRSSWRSTAAYCNECAEKKRQKNADS